MDFCVNPMEKNFFVLLRESFLETISTLRMVWSGLVGMISGKFSFKDISGPVGIASIVGQAAYEGLKVDVVYALNNIISLMALITINLGVINLLPLPALDGGRLLFLFFEMIFKKPVSAKYEGLIHAVGFILLMIVTVLATLSDIAKLIPWR
jgi:regulator of sigma E protease